MDDKRYGCNNKGISCGRLQDDARWRAFSVERDPRIKIVGDAQNGTELKAWLKKNTADVVVLDIYLDALGQQEGETGIQLCRYLRQTYPKIKVVMHSKFDDAERVSGALAAHAKGFVSKRSGYEELVNAIHAVCDGKLYICKEIAKRMRNLNQFLLGIEHHLRDRSEIFSAREREVLVLMAQGKSSKEIANDLNITERTVESHRKNMIDKCGVKNSAELIAQTAWRGMIKR